jgi:hypothetical protein
VEESVDQPMRGKNFHVGFYCLPYNLYAVSKLAVFKTYEDKTSKLYTSVQDEIRSHVRCRPSYGLEISSGIS